MAHVSDSRLYLSRNGELEQLSMDHTVSEEFVRRGLVSREQKIRKQEGCSNCEVVANCCNPAAQLHAKRNQEQSQTELQRLLVCPECGSANYNEEIV